MLALTWENLLWICGICNQTKGNRFDEQVQTIEPTRDDVWSHFFIDKFGNLSAKWDAARNDLDERAVRTIEYHNLDRQALQECRQERLEDLIGKVKDSLALHEEGRLTLDELFERALQWFEQPFQPDVADYFLRGPGSLDANFPFKGFIEILSASDPPTAFRR